MNERKDCVNAVMCYMLTHYKSCGIHFQAGSVINLRVIFMCELTLYFPKNGISIL